MVITRTIKPQGTTETYFSPVLSCACFVHGVFLPEYSCGVHLGVYSGKIQSLFGSLASTYTSACLHNTEEGSEKH